MTQLNCPRCNTPNYYSPYGTPYYICKRCRFGELEWAFHGWGDLTGYHKAFTMSFRKAVEEKEIQKLIEGV